MTRFGRVRIRVKTPESNVPEPPHGGFPYPTMNGLAPSWVDAEIGVVAPDGSEIPIDATSVAFSLKEGAEVAHATVVVIPDEIDVEAIGRITWEEREPKAKDTEDAKGTLFRALESAQASETLTDAGRAAIRRLERAIADGEQDPIGKTVESIQHRKRSGDF